MAFFIEFDLHKYHHTLALCIRRAVWPLLPRPVSQQGSIYRRAHTLLRTRRRIADKCLVIQVLSIRSFCFPFPTIKRSASGQTRGFVNPLPLKVSFVVLDLKVL